jgi:hypothetical protein
MGSGEDVDGTGKNNEQVLALKGKDYPLDLELRCKV